jgi:uncharacterized protein with PIN domain
VTELENSVSRCKECGSELSGVRREAARWACQIYLQTQGEISRWLGPLKIKTVWRETQCRVTEHSGILCQEGIELV